MTNFDIVKAALEYAQQEGELVLDLSEALTALARIEADHFTAADMASAAAAQGHRDGVASVTVEQEPVAWAVYWGLPPTRKNSVHFDKESAQAVANQIKSATEVRPLYAAPVAQQQQAEHDLKDVRCECCGYMTHHREHMGCIRAASKQPQAEAAPMSQPNRLIAYSAAAKLRELGYHWDEEAEAWAPQQAEAVRDAMVEAAYDAVADALRDAYDCTRDWSAWSYGTMGPDDFVILSEDSDRVREIAGAAIDAAWQAMRDAGHPPDGHTPLAQAITKALAPQQAEAVPPGYVIDRGFRWDGENQQHIPQLTIEFEPVPANGPCDAKGWKDRDAVAQMFMAQGASHE